MQTETRQLRDLVSIGPSMLKDLERRRLLLWSYTSRMALITVSGSSNWIYSELLRTKICLAFEDSPSQRAWASVISCSYFRCSGVSGGFLSRWPTPWFPEVSTRMGPGAEWAAVLLQI